MGNEGFTNVVSWQRSYIKAMARLVNTNDPRFLVVKMQSEYEEILLVNVYLP